MAVVFRCERAGLKSLLLGGYDGTGTWTIVRSAVSDAAEHMVVQAHEAMHHELQLSTTWGRLCALSGLLGKRSSTPRRYLDVFDAAVDSSRTVHEIYATALSDGIASQRTTRDVLADNPVYFGYRDRARRLVPQVEDVSDELRLSAVAAILRCCMHPRRALDATMTSFERLTPAMLYKADTPDQRLAAFEAHTDPARWTALLRELGAANPRLHIEILGRRPTEQADAAVLAQQWAWEVGEVQRRCFELAADILAASGSSSLDWTDLPFAARAAIASATAVDPELGALMRAVEGSPGPEVDVLEFDRQKLELRSSLPAEWIADPGDTIALVDGFTVVDPASGDSHVYGLWLETAMLHKQFADVPAIDERHSVVLVARAPDGRGGTVARLGRLNPHTTPVRAQELVGERPLVAITTHSFLVDESAAAIVDGASPVFVLMDLPIGHQIRHWITQASKVSWGVAPVDTEKEISALVVRTRRAPHLVFFSVGGMLAHGSLLERLRQAVNPQQFEHDSAVIEDSLPGLRLAIQAVMATFHILDQDGPT
jgi:hypothetical protein